VEPLVVLDVDYVRDSFVLVLANVGTGMAYDPRVHFSAPLVGAGGTTKVSELPLWSTLTMLRPGKAIEVFFDTAPLALADGNSPQFAATVTYSDGAGERFKHRYVHSLGAYRDLPRLES